MEIVHVAAAAKPPEKEERKVFIAVYDEFRRGLRKSGKLYELGAEFVQTVTIPGYQLIDFGENRVTVIHARSAPIGTVCDLYTISLSSLAILDEIMDCPNLYDREIVGGTENVYIYCVPMHIASARRVGAIVWISCNDYKAYLKEKENGKTEQGFEEE